MQQNLEGFRLSPQQQRIWPFIAQEKGATYCAQAAIAIVGHLNRTILQTAIAQVVARHEILRTTFHCLPGMDFPVQAIAPEGTPFLLAEAGSDLSSSLQANQPESRLVALRQQPFDLEQGPTVCMESIRQSAERHVLLLHVSVLCADKISLYNLAREISKTYESCLQNAIAADIPLQYADLAQWQHEILEDEAAQAGREYWSRCLANSLTRVHLPLGQCPPEQTEFRPKTEVFPLPIELVSQAEALAQQQGTSLSTLLLACWQVLLWRLTQQSPLTVGIGCEGRQYKELESALGLFSKTLPLICVLDELAPFLDYLQQTQNSLNEQTRWQDYFTGTIPTTPEQSLPFGFEFGQHPEPWTIPHLTFSIEQVWVCTERFQVKLTCRQHSGGISLVWDYDPHCYSVEAIQRLAGQFQTLLTSVLHSPETALGQLNVLTPAERQQLLVAFNPPVGQKVAAQSIHQIFEDRVIRHRDRNAILSPEGTLTYTQLNLRANQLAHYLRSLGVRTGDLVGLCVTRSPFIAVGILGILKAGAAYVPLDPTYPSERLTAVLEDVQIYVLLTQSDWESMPCPTLESSQPIQRVYLDQQWSVIAQFPSDNLVLHESYPDLAYVIYTSGSTGKPKGVQISHGNLCHYVQAMQQSLGIQETDIYLHTASIAFSSSVRQLMVPLCQGATVAIATAQQRADPLLLFGAIQDYGVTAIDLVPSYWRNCIQRLLSLPEGERQRLLNNALRLILSASEPLWADIPRRWRTEVKHPAQFINLFGQTETSGIVAAYPIPETE
ncbi:MAG: AMP-binding protein [Acaryochloridaceae cyanobacterium RU_4_10]|nr:AMP-binding protein [Acaryochloridaceae cyanobacterium RU_4_10]